jgi:endo-1,4-beta-mannosidase
LEHIVIERPFLKLSPATHPQIWLGANFWSRVGGPLMWRTFDRDVVREELRVLYEHGLNVTRSFFYWPDFMPAPDTIDEIYVVRYAQFLDLCTEEQISTIPTFIVGHMSGENWDVPWRNGCDLYSDGWMLAQQAFFIRTLAQRFKDHAAVAGWLISNEMPIYGGNTTAEMGRSWAQLMVQAVHAAGARHPISLGEGAWGIEVSGSDNGFRLRDLAPTVDFIGPHVYPQGDDLVRQHLTAAFICELSHMGKPVILEEFGVTTDFTSDEHAGEYYRQVLHTSLLAGAVGWIAWNNTDFDLTHQDPYRHHPFELHFGITRTDGTPKAPLLELEKFRKVLNSIDIAHCHRAGTDSAILLTSYFDTAYPFTDAAERSVMRDILRQAYVVTREADLGSALVREQDGIPDVRLILVPSTKQLTGPTWEALEARVREGATVYVSYFSGARPVHRGPWHSSFNEFFGIEHQLRYGLLNPVNDETVTFTFAEDFGTLKAGESLTFRVGGNENGRAFLPCVPTEVRVLAKDQHGQPALLERAVGRGKIILSTYPLEYFAASIPNANPDDTYQLYRALAAHAHVEPVVTVDSPVVLVDALVHEDGTQFVWLISESEHSLLVTPRKANGKALSDLFTQEVAPETIELEPLGVRVFRMISQ